MAFRLTRFEERMSDGQSVEFCQGLARLFAGRITDDCCRSRITLLIEQCDIDSIVDLEPDFGLSVNDFYSVVQIVALYKKRVDIVLAGHDRQLTAKASFLAAEADCETTNRAFASWSRGGFQFRPYTEAVLHMAQRKISEILGVVPKLCDLRFRFGPGATTTVKKREAHPVTKMDKPLACSGDLSRVVGYYLEEMPHLVRNIHEDSDVVNATVEIHNGRIALVPKTAKTDRVISVEPALNSLIQLGIGDYISRRLSRFGIDLSDQTHNQRLARIGSIDDSLATIDLSSASDTVSRGLVAHLLPLDWYLLLSESTTSMVDFDGRTMKLEKFSTMGNGFTFPLETLIFYTLAFSVSKIEGCRSDRDVVSVYGDDIIVPSAACLPLCRVLREVGFTPNPSKTFSTGPFRESCGCDYFRGTNVRPVYLKDTPRGHDLFRLHNFFVRRGDDESAAYCRGWIADSLAIYGPDSFGDGHLIGDWTPEPVHLEREYGGVTFKTYTFRPKLKAISPDCFGWSVYPHYHSYLRGFNSNPIRIFEGEPYFWSERRGLRIQTPGVTKVRLTRVYTFNRP